MNIYKERTDITKEINLSSDRIWIFKCKEGCSICPSPISKISNLNEKGNKFVEHFLGWLEKNKTKYIEAETLIFHCPKCNQKWAVVGEIPNHVRLAFDTNNREGELGSRLTCYAC